MTYDNLDRDILASLGVHFQTAFAGHLPVFFEGQHIDGEPAIDYLEVRIEGPEIDEIANEQYQVTVDVDIKIVRKKTSNIFLIRTDAGKCAEALRLGIPLMQPSVDIEVETLDPITYIQIGGETYVDSVTELSMVTQPALPLGCLDTMGFYGRRNKIKTHHFGQLKNKNILVATVATTLSILL